MTLTVARQQQTGAPMFLRIGFWACIGIAIAVVIRRLFALAASPSGTSPNADLDRIFSGYAGLTLAHILPSLLFVILAPIALLSRGRRAPWAEGLLFPVGVIVGITAYAMSTYSVGGWVERSAVFLFDTLFLLSLGMAFRWKSDPVRKRRWLLRAVIVLLGIATTRPVMGIFFATSRLSHLQPNQFFGLAFWIGFSINATIGELWLRYGRMAPGAATKTGSVASSRDTEVSKRR